jgi:hypothetical protein
MSDDGTFTALLDRVRFHLTAVVSSSEIPAETRRRVEEDLSDNKLWECFAALVGDFNKRHVAPTAEAFAHLEAAASALGIQKWGFWQRLYALAAQAAPPDPRTADGTTSPAILREFARLLVELDQDGCWLRGMFDLALRVTTGDLEGFAVETDGDADAITVRRDTVTFSAESWEGPPLTISLAEFIAMIALGIERRQIQTAALPQSQQQSPPDLGS